MTDSDGFAAARALERDDSRPVRRQEIPVLGIPVAFESEDRAALDAVRGVIRPQPPASDDEVPTTIPRVRLRVDRHAVEPGSGPLHVHVDPGGRLLATGGGAMASAWLDSMEAVAVVSPALLQNRIRLIELLRTLVLFLVTRLDRLPVHAAAFMAGSTAIVLAGRSGAGKSTLAYVADRLGHPPLSDDAVYVQLEPRFRLWGLGGPLYLTHESRHRFPQLRGMPIVVRSDGSPKLFVETLSPPPPPTDDVRLCLLEWGSGETRVEPIHPMTAVTEMIGALAPGFDAFGDGIGPSLRALAARGVWRVRVADGPDEVVLRLAERFG